MKSIKFKIKTAVIILAGLMFASFNVAASGTKSSLGFIVNYHHAHFKQAEITGLDYITPGPGEKNKEDLFRVSAAAAPTHAMFKAFMRLDPEYVHNNWAFDDRKFIHFRLTEHNPHLIRFGPNSMRNFQNSLFHCYHSYINVIRWKECPSGSRNVFVGWGSDSLNFRLVPHTRLLNNAKGFFRVHLTGTAAVYNVNKQETCKKYSKAAFNRGYVSARSVSYDDLPNQPIVPQINVQNGPANFVNCEYTIKLPARIDMKASKGHPRMLRMPDNNTLSSMGYSWDAMFYLPASIKRVYNRLGNNQHAGNRDFEPVLTKAPHHGDHFRVTISHPNTSLSRQPISGPSIWWKAAGPLVAQIFTPFLFAIIGAI